MSSKSIKIHPINKFEDVFDRIGSFGLFQWLVFLSCQYISICTAVNWSFMSFGGLVPKYFCDGTIKEGISSTDANKEYCAKLGSNGSNCFNETIKTPEFFSVVQDWHLVCGLDYIPALLTTGQMVAQIITNPIVGPLIDYFGRKWIMFVGFVGLIASGSFTSFSTDWKMMAVAFVLVGIFVGTAIQVMFTFSLELVGPKHRIPMACAFQWTLVVQVMALIAYLTGTWRKLLLVGNLICIPMVILLFLVPESPRWLIQKGRTDEALKSIQLIAKINRRTKDHQLVTLKDLNAIEILKSSHPSILSLFTTKKRTIYTLWVVLAGLCIGVTYSVILFGIGDLAGSVYLNMSLYGLLRIWAPLVMIGMEWKTRWFGRRMLYLSSGAIVFFCFAGITLLHILNKAEAWGLVKTILAQTGCAVSVSLVFTAWNQYSIELFPTLLRGTSVGVAEMATNIGSALAPQFIYFKKYWTGTPYAAVAVLGLISWIYALVALPETKGKPLPDVVGQEEKLDQEGEDNCYDNEMSHF